jgi:rubrerythrin
MKESLHATFRTVLGLAGVSATTLPLLACDEWACGSEPGDAPRQGRASAALARSQDFSPVLCSEAEFPAPLYLTDLAPAEPFDCLELRSFDTTLEAQGSACTEQGLPSLAARFSEPALEELRLGVPGESGRSYQLLATRGSEQLHVGTLEQLRNFLGGVDRLGEAQLLVASQGYELLCGKSGGAARDTGFDVLAYTFEGCDGRTRYLLHIDGQGSLSVKEAFVERYADPCCTVGRRPEGFRGRERPPSTLGALVTGWAELEAASVPAFLRLASELHAHGAPRALVERAGASARDEARHARAMARLARRWGGCPQLPRLTVGPTRSLERVALENAVEGCVLETHAALVAHHQARRAQGAGVAALFRGIAVDETRHAQLSWHVASWAEGRLSPAARRRIAVARNSTVQQLNQRAAAAPPSGAELVGLPDPERSVALVAALDRALWQRA